MRRWTYWLVSLAVFVFVASGISQDHGKLVINHFVADPDHITRLYVTDFEGVGADVVVTFYSEAGEIIGQKKVKLPQNGTVPLKPFDIIQRRAVGNVRVEGKGGRVACEYWQIIEHKDYSYSVATPGQSAAGHSNLVVQHFVSDPDLNTIIFLTNPNEGSTASVSLEFHTEDGETISKVERSIGPNATLVLKPYDVIQRRAYGNVYIVASGATISGEYWQLVDHKREDGKREQYAVAIPLQTLNLFSK
jgi:hypothetical protein